MTNPTPRTWASEPEVADGAVLEATGRSWDEWCDIIDGRPNLDEDHAAIAAYLEDAHSLDGWWAQTVTVGYERIAGLRLPYQRPDGTFTASSSKTVVVNSSRLRAMLLDADGRTELFGELDSELRSNPASKTIRIAIGPGVAAISITDVGRGRAKVTVAHEKLPRFDDVERWKTYWARWLETLDDTGRVLEG